LGIDLHPTRGGTRGANEAAVLGSASAYPSDDPVVADRMAGTAVPFAADGDREAGIAYESDRRDHVRDAMATRDQRGEPIDGPVSDPCGGGRKDGLPGMTISPRKP
jgi:hypothetical protein